MQVFKAFLKTSLLWRRKILICTNQTLFYWVVLYRTLSSLKYFQQLFSLDYKSNPQCTFIRLHLNCISSNNIIGIIPHRVSIKNVLFAQGLGQVQVKSGTRSKVKSIPTKNSKSWMKVELFYLDTMAMIVLPVTLPPPSYCYWLQFI